jgi:hypothetical protein
LKTIEAGMRHRLEAVNQACAEYEKQLEDFFREASGTGNEVECRIMSPSINNYEEYGKKLEQDVIHHVFSYLKEHPMAKYADLETSVKNSCCVSKTYASHVIRELEGKNCIVKRCVQGRSYYEMVDF